MNNMVVLKLCPMEQVSYDACIGGDLNADGVFYCPHRGQIMGVGSDPAGSLYKKRGITGITALQYNFNPPEHLTGTPGVFDFASLHLHFDAQMAFYSGNRIDDNSFAHFISSLFLRVFVAIQNQIGPRLLIFLKDLLAFFKEWRHFVPETRFAAADAGVPSLYWPACPIVKLGNGTVVIGVRSFATHLVKAVAHFSLF